MDRAAMDGIAEAYERFLGRWSRLWAPALVAAARVEGGHRVLDVAAGTGEAAMAAGERVGAGGLVVASDLSPGMLRLAPARAGEARLVRAAMDAQGLALRDASFDAALSHLGVAAVADPETALAELARVVRPGGWVAVSVWAEPDCVPFPGAVADVLARRLPAESGDWQRMFALSDEVRLESLLTGAELEEIAVERESRPLKFDDFADLWEPVEAAWPAYHDLPGPERQALRDEVRARLARYDAGGRLVMDCEMLIAAGRRAR